MESHFSYLFTKIYETVMIPHVLMSPLHLFHTHDTHTSVKALKPPVDKSICGLKTKKELLENLIYVNCVEICLEQINKVKYLPQKTTRWLSP